MTTATPTPTPTPAVMIRPRLEAGDLVRAIEVPGISPEKFKTVFGTYQSLKPAHQRLFAATGLIPELMWEPYAEFSETELYGHHDSNRKVSLYLRQWAIVAEFGNPVTRIGDQIHILSSDHHYPGLEEKIFTVDHVYSSGAPRVTDTETGSWRVPYTWEIVARRGDKMVELTPSAVISDTADTADTNYTADIAEAAAVLLADYKKQVVAVAKLLWAQNQGPTTGDWCNESMKEAFEKLDIPKEYYASTKQRFRMSADVAIDPNDAELYATWDAMLASLRRNYPNAMTNFDFEEIEDADDYDDN